MEKVMKKYELMLIVAPDVESSKLNELLDKLIKTVETSGGKVENNNILGKKSLAYRIKRFNEGVYLLFDLNLPSDEIVNLDKRIRLEEKIIRHLIIVK